MSESPVQSLSRAFSVLQAVASLDKAATIAEISFKTGLARSTVYRLVASLQSEGYLMAEDNRFVIGFELLPLAAALLDKNPLRLAALPHLQVLSDKVGERTNLGVLDRGKIMILGGVERPSLPTIYSRFGRVIPPHRSALGKALLSQLSEQEILAIVGQEPFERSASKTITTMNELLKDLEETRIRGYSMEIGENSETSQCIAALITRDNARAVGAISISISSRNNVNISEFAPALLQTAELISHIMPGHSSNP